MSKWKFEPNLDYQISAINAVVNLFEGQEKINDTDSMRFYRNELTISKNRIEENLMKIQKNPENNVGYWDDKLLPDNKFTIEMETGTGKTYVYLRTILELYNKYGFSKFMIVVPSIPIRMGVEKSIWQLREHFMSLYGGLDITNCYFIYESKKTLNKLDAFTQLGGLKIAIMNYQAFDKSSNTIKNAKENGKVYWDEIKRTNPIVIIDEPQKIIGTSQKKSKALKSIEELKPLATLMYSATHTNYYNLIYKLDSFEAFKKNLVKKIRVSTIWGNVDKNYPYFRYVKFNKNLSATVEVLKENKGIVKLSKLDIDRPCDLYDKTHLKQYKGFRILNSPHRINGIKTNFYDEILNDTYSFSEGENNYNLYEDDMIEIQMKLTIKRHLDKQIDMLKENVKVLSLFFIDEVVKYRDYSRDDTLGIYAKKFEEVYEEVINSDFRYINLIREMPSLSNPKKVHEGYFALDKNRKVVMDENTYIKDTEKTRDDIQRGIKKILDGKEQLIQLNEPIAFIFAHSALSEGWDNPNIFQLCFLRQTKSNIRKKQEIGRGLRLARGSGENNDIKRDENINELTIIANENYEEFAESLQREFNEDCHYNKEAITIEDTKNIQLLIEEKMDDKLSNNFFKILHNELLDAGFIKQKDNTIDKNKISKLESYYYKNIELNRNRDRIYNALVSVMNEKESRNIEIINNDEVIENNWQKYITENNFQKMLNELKEKLSKKTIYKIAYNEDELIYNIIVEVGHKIKNYDKEFTEKTGVLDGSNRDKGVIINEIKKQEDKFKIKEKISNTKSFVEIINYVVNRTNFTRDAIIKIIMQSQNPVLFQRQDNIDKLIKIIEDQKRKQYYKYMDNIEYTVIREKKDININNMFLVNEIMSTNIGKKVFESKEENRKSLCKYFLMDSDGEMEFAAHLEDNENVLMYSKIKKGSFIIENPIENYSPDWAIVYKINDDEAMIYMIAETKWKKEWEDLSDKEKIKIVCAKKHFNAIDNEVKYDWINSVDKLKESIDDSYYYN